MHIIWLNSNNSFGPFHFSLLPSASFQAVLLVNSPKLAALVNLTVLLCSCSLRVQIATSTNMTVAARSTGEAEVI